MKLSTEREIPPLSLTTSPVTWSMYRVNFLAGDRSLLSVCKGPFELELIVGTEYWPVLISLPISVELKFVPHL